MNIEDLNIAELIDLKREAFNWRFIDDLQKEINRRAMIDTVRLKRIRKRAGRCYELAYRGLKQSDNLRFALVHGEVNGPPDLAPRTGHAWLESNIDPIVYDAVKDKTIPIDDYYRLANPTNITKYTIIEAGYMIEETNHYGPWSED